MISIKHALIGATIYFICTTSLALPIVHIDSGVIQGDTQDGIDRYLGIPYAEAPTGRLRWRAPRAPKKWKGRYYANSYGNICPQMGNYYASNNANEFGKPVGNEDCLYLNIWAPSDAPILLPVVVFIHGGAGIYGAASLPLYDGKKLADNLQAVVVSFNYRLGILGGLHSPTLGGNTPADNSGNFALLDQIEALKWVKRNISAFSGDKHNVTVMGQSAGCVSIWSLMKSPLAKALFNKSICLSGIPLGSSEQERHARFERFLGQARSLRNLPIENSMSPAEQRSFLYSMSSEEITLASVGLKALTGPADGHVLNANPQTVVNPVPTIIGNVGNEASLLLEPIILKLDRQSLWRKIARNHQQLDRHDILPGQLQSWLYHLAVKRTNRKLLQRVNQSAAVLSEYSMPVYRYHFDWEWIPQPWKWAFGSFHGIDLPFIFGNFQQENQSFTDFAFTPQTTAQQLRTHQLLTLSLKGFVEDGKPSKYLPRMEWPQYGNSRKVQKID